MNKIRSTTIALVAAAAMAATAVLPAGAQEAPAAPQSVVSSDVTVAFAVFDRTSNRTTLQYNEHKKIRSASVVKILIALDYFETYGADTEIPAADLALLQPMLRSSDDNAASELWVRLGWEEIVERAVVRLHLHDTEPPVNVGFWGYTALSAADVVTIYRHVLDEARPKVRDFVMGNLHQATACATDGFDQSFGIPRAVPGDVAFKQGWSRFGDVPPRPCVEPKPKIANGAAKEGPLSERGVAADLDLTSPAMHTTGTYGGGDRKIMAVLTLEPEGTTWDESAQRITLVTGAVYLAERFIAG
ncbi:hypothetical protein [Umezawaea sp. Da 62-37]|uniref:hypothetical protein n=1 Tax=Umezawaea sp. Da 62-37 TaxID=3075927 RepID=UPI0028F6D1A8|nr:hypothetical protein [Umezawaea sp. Da 62-37]WNV82754.1 hypothetical protein RM788_31735 [Umezawaea sp. Da 62-37]